MTKDEIKKAIEEIQAMSPDARKGAIDALMDIFLSQQGGAGIPQDTEIEIDPDLETPVGKAGKMPKTDIDDPDGVLNQAKIHRRKNQKQDPQDPSESGMKGSQGQGGGQQDNPDNPENPEDNPGEEGKEGQQGQEGQDGQEGQGGQQGQQGNQGGQKGSKGSKGGSQSGGGEETGDDDGSGDIGGGDKGDEKDGDGKGTGGQEGDESGKGGDKEDSKEGEGSGSGNGEKEGEGEGEGKGSGTGAGAGEGEGEEDDGVDYSKVHKELSDKEKAEAARQKKTEASRVAQLGRKALNKAPADADPSKVQRIKDLTEELEKIAGSSNADANAVDWDDIRAKENELLDLIKDMVTVHETPDRPERIKRAKDIINNPVVSQQVQQEITADKRNDPTLVKKYGLGQLNVGSYYTMGDFKADIKLCIDSQVARRKETVKTFSVPNKRHAAAGSPMVVKGTRRKTIEKKDAPLIAVFVDQSGSWNDDDIQKGKESMSILDELVRKGDIKEVQYYFFANGVYELPEQARREGGTHAWPKVMDKIKEIGADNVVIMSDDDLADQSSPQTPLHVEGCVWWIWKYSTSPRCTKELIGDAGNFQYKLY